MTAWDKEYNSHGKLWGAGPSMLGIAAVAYARKHAPKTRRLEILDIGCGYGRDSCHLAESINCRVVGIDTSEKAIASARREVSTKGYKNIDFRCRDFKDVSEEQYDILFISNLYQLLKQAEREELRNTARRVLRAAGGLLFLSTLSVADPEHFGKGAAVANERNSFDDGKFLHFCTQEELTSDFSFLDIKELSEREYDEPRATGETHHHISWILIGEKI
jgi:cyclopropane fatty-acyl-phospholipid synthase-like methyltransferase